MIESGMKDQERKNGHGARNLTTHSTGARVSLAFIVKLDGFGVVCAPG
jgi:hypothetical protein